MKKILEIYEKPPVVTRDEYTHILSIVLCKPKAYSWFIENYIQLLTCYREGFTEADPMFYNFIDYSSLSNTEFCLVGNNKSCPFLDFYRHTCDEYKDYGMSFIEYLKYKITNDFYIFIYLDVSQIKAYNSKQTFFAHCPLIIGFDDELQVFYFRDYCSHSYGTNMATYEEIENGFISFVNRCQIYIELKPFYEYGISFLKLTDGDSYIFNKDKMFNLLNDYLHGGRINDTYYTFFSNRAFYYGIETYDIIIKTLEYCMEQDQEDIGGIYKFSLLQDHKHVMLLRLEYLKENNYICSKDYDVLYLTFKKAEDISAIIKRLYIKYDYKKDKSLIYKIIDNLRVLKKMDEKDINTLIAAGEGEK